MIKKWRGIKEIMEKATKELIETQEDGYLFYSAPTGYKLILSVITILPSTLRMQIKDFGINKNGMRDRILKRGFKEDDRMITDDDKPLLELVKEEEIGADEIKERISEEWKKSRLRVQGRELSRTSEEKI